MQAHVRSQIRCSLLKCQFYSVITFRTFYWHSEQIKCKLWSTMKNFYSLSIKIIFSKPSGTPSLPQTPMGRLLGPLWSSHLAILWVRPRAWQWGLRVLETSGPHGPSKLMKWSFPQWWESAERKLTFIWVAEVEAKDMVEKEQKPHYQ